MSNRAKNLVTTALFLGGVAVLVALARSIGLEPLRRHARELLWFVPAGVALQFLVHFVNALGWYHAIEPRARARLPLWQCFLAWNSGDLVNWATPGAIGGEYVRAHQVRDRVPMSTGIASVTVARLSQITAQFAFVGLALALSWSRLALGPTERLVVLVVVGGAVVFVAGNYALQRTRMFGWVVAGLRRAGARGSLMDRVDAALRRIDAEMGQYHDEAPGDFYRSIAWFFLGWALQLLDVVMILYALDVPMDWRAVLAIEALAVFVEAIAFLVPGKVGADEGGRVLIFEGLGYAGAVGLGFSLFRRARELIWFGFCLAVLFWLRRRVDAKLSGPCESPSTPAAS
ncbi:MAG TPA: flippase-like domain-containing protein [Planctomycetota bacterium]|nr:flippase-like domain-containing protein [Planctomycetota bacterium]